MDNVYENVDGVKGFFFFSFLLKGLLDFHIFQGTKKLPTEYIEKVNS